MTFAKALADACHLGLQRIQAPGVANHNTLYLNGCLLLLRRLRERLNETGQLVDAELAETKLPGQEYEALVESAPATVRKAAPREEAEKFKKELEACGATVSLKKSATGRGITEPRP